MYECWPPGARSRRYYGIFLSRLHENGDPTKNCITSIVVDLLIGRQVKLDLQK